MEHTSSVKTANILFVDDEQSILETLKRFMRNSQYKCFYANSGKAALEILENEIIDIVVSDMKMPEMNGEQLLREVSKTYPETIRIVLSGFSEDELIMAAINEGHIWGFIHKPWNNTELSQAIDQAVFTQQVIAERALLKRTLNQYKAQQKDSFQGFIGSSVSMQFVYSSIEKAAPSNASIMITGESGTGKEVTAKSLHDLSKRADKPFIALNCAAIPSELMESEIFGHTKGAFSGAVSQRDGAATLANGGTLFFDELSEMDISLQSKLLRFIQTGTFQRVGSSQLEKVDIRFICATNRDPIEAIQDKKLREDLYYRLNVISINLPPLKQRNNDPYLLAQTFLSKFTNMEDKTVVGFSSNAEKLILTYEWPGNVRQLENAIHNAVVMSSGPLITDQCLANALNVRLDDIKTNAIKNEQRSVGPNNTHSENITNITRSYPEERTTVNETNVIEPLAKIEEQAIKQAIDYCEGNVVRAASLLQVSPSTLYRKVQSWEQN
jgi:DNA-binding NtrC family response regulator